MSHHAYDIAHAFLPPSGAEAWEKCAKWAWMNQQYPQEPDEATIEGVGAHKVIEMMHAGESVSEGLLLENGAVVTEEMIEGAELYIDTIKELCGNATIQYQESRVFSSFHEQCWGTPDFFAYTAAAGIIDIVDYKFGHGFVDEFENRQCLIYADGVLNWLCAQLHKQRCEIENDLQIRITVVQPRCFYKGKPVRTWTLPASHLQPWVEHFKRRAEVTLNTSHHEHAAVTGDHCEHCPGRHACDALHKSAYQSAEIASKYTQIQLTPEAAALELRMLEKAARRLDARIEGLRELVTKMTVSGQAVPFYGIEHSKPRERWKLAPEQIVAIGKMYKKELGKLSVVTPKQALKLGIDEAVIKQYSEAPKGSAKLVPVDETVARRVFGNFNK